MKEWFYPTAFSCWDDEEDTAIDRVMTSGRFTQGEEVAAFEGEFAAFHGGKHAVMVNSGSSANLLAVAALAHLGQIKRGDKVVVPALAWSTTYAPLVQYGLELVLVDCDETWNADPFAMGDVTDAKLIIGCSILGNAGYLPMWANAAGVLGAEMIEDNCESIGASVDGRLCGTFGLMGTFSLFWSHQVSAIEGGVILTDDDECASACRMLRAHGWTRDLGGAPPAFDREYDFRAFGYNVRGLELHAAIAREQLRKLPGFVTERRANANLFARLAIEAGLEIALQNANGTPNPFGMQFCVKDGLARDRAVAALRAAGIDCRLPTGGSLRKHAYGAPWASQTTRVADTVHDTGLFLGNASFDIGEQITKAVEVLREAL